MRILDNYIIRSVTRIFFSTILIFTFLYVLIDAATHLDDFIANKAPALTVLQYYLNFLPVIFVQTSPIASLLAALFTYSSLNNNNEIIALRASGMDFWKIARPAIIFGLIVTAFVFLVNEKFVPQAASLAQEIKKEKLEGNAKNRAKGEQPPVKYLFFYGTDNRLFFIDEFTPATKSLRGLTVIRQDNEQRMTEKLVALGGEWTGTSWKLSNCQLTNYNPMDQSLVGDAPFYKEKAFDLGERPEDFLKQRTAVTSMNIKELKHYIKRFKGSGAVSALNSLKVDLHQRIAYPFACIVILFVGLPFALTTGKRKGLTFASVGIALLIGFLFYVVNAVGLALGKGGVLPPFAAAWMAPALFVATGVYIIRKLF
jgi:lipopolysaccharide export system permease protein